MKKITIGSMTADIGDGLIVDGSASATTTYSSDKINTLNSTQDTTITNNYNTLNTNKLNKAWQLRTGNWAWKMTYNNGSWDETEVSLWAAWTILASNWATSAPTFQFATADVNWQTEDTTGAMDNDFFLVYDASATANRKQKINVYRATQSEVLARSSTTKFVVPAYMPTYANGTTTKNAADASATQNIAHWLWVVPKYVRITAICECSGGAWDSIPAISWSVYNGTTQSSVSFYTNSTSFAFWAGTVDTTFTLNINWSSGTQTWVITVDATNIIITWTKTNSPTGTYTLLWEANT